MSSRNDVSVAFAADEGFVYSMVKSGPDVSPDDVEVADVAAVEVMVLWDTNVLHVSHLTPPRSYYVGETMGSRDRCDYFVASETLGFARAPIVVSHGEGASLVILPGARGYVDVPGYGRTSLARLVADGRVRPSREARGAYEYDLPPGAKARTELPGSAIAFEVTAVNAGKRAPVGFFQTTEPAALLYSGASFLLHVGLIATFAFFMPRMNGDEAPDVDRDRFLTMQKLLNAAAEREPQERDDAPVAESTPDRREGGSGARARNEEGSSGTPTTRATGHKYGVEGPKDNPDPHLARQAALDEALRFGMIGLVSTMTGGDPNAPTVPWGRDTSSGHDDKSALGNLFGDTIGESIGAGGVGLTGLGEGGGGPADGIGLNDVGGLDHGGGSGPGDSIGVGVGRPPRGHQPQAPHIRESNPEVNGRLPPEVIQRIVRQNFGRFRICYQNGMRENPSLQGRVSVKFAIDRSGAVAMTADGGSDLPDRNVVQCVVRAFGNLSFPEPQGGMVTVVYPVLLTPGD